MKNMIKHSSAQPEPVEIRELMDFLIEKSIYLTIPSLRRFWFFSSHVEEIASYVSASELSFYNRIIKDAEPSVQVILQEAHSDYFGKNSEYIRGIFDLIRFRVPPLTAPVEVKQTEDTSIQFSSEEQSTELAHAIVQYSIEEGYIRPDKKMINIVQPNILSCIKNIKLYQLKNDTCGETLCPELVHKIASYDTFIEAGREEINAAFPNYENECREQGLIKKRLVASGG